MEHVVLVNESNQVLGIENKSVVHGKSTPLHRAFSVFIFDQQNQLLLQQRAEQKITWPLIWSNSCCGHPQLNESNIDAALRRCQFELGIEVTDIIEVAPYRYCFSYNNIIENEICPIIVARYNGQIAPNTEEVCDVKWIDWRAWLQQIALTPAQYSPWSVEESQILTNNHQFLTWLKQTAQL
jgi:isopentenyl-diphosphate delta-isomerase